MADRKRATAGARVPTDLADLPRRLETMERLASVGTLAAGLAHEVNNPLSVVIANAAYVAEELARIRDEDDAGRRGWIDEAITAQGELIAAADRIARIVADLRELARPRHAGDDPPRAEVAAAIARAVRTTTPQLRERARVVTEVAPELPAIAGDETRVAHVLVGLISNAGQAYAPDGGAKRRAVFVRARLGPTGFVELEVADTGSGMAPEVLARAFEPLFSTRPDAAGLGLAVCESIVASLGGTITATSSLGHGTTVIVRVPAVATTAVAPAVPRAPRARVLVIDDDAAVRRALVRMLREHDVVTATSGADGLAAIARSSHEFDVIFTDVAMPDMTGIELYRELQATRPTDAARIVFVTGDAVTADVRAFLASVPNDHLEKPVRGAMLDELIAKLVLAIPVATSSG